MENMRKFSEKSSFFHIVKCFVTNVIGILIEIVEKNRFSNYQKVVNLGFPYSLGFYSIRKTTKIFKESDIVFSKSISDMPKFNRYDIDWKPEKNDKTGPNIILKALPRLSFYDKTSGKLISKQKVPRDMRGFAKLNKPSQAHLIAMTFDPEEPGTTLYYNKSCNQYGAQIQRYFSSELKNVKNLNGYH